MQVLGQEVPATDGFRSGHNECIPKRELITVLKFPTPLQNRGVHRHGVPSQQIFHFGARLVAALWPFPFGLVIKLLQHLKTDSPEAARPQFFPPRAGRLLLLQVRPVERVKEDIRINEDRRGHESPHAIDIAPRS